MQRSEEQHELAAIERVDERVGAGGGPQYDQRGVSEDVQFKYRSSVSREHVAQQAKVDLQGVECCLRPNGHAVREPLDVGHELHAPDASLDDNESAPTCPETSIEYLSIAVAAAEVCRWDEVSGRVF